MGAVTSVIGSIASGLRSLRRRMSYAGWRSVSGDGCNGARGRGVVPEGFFWEFTKVTNTDRQLAE